MYLQVLANIRYKALLATLLATLPLPGQQLPLKSFSASDGLQGGGIARILKDTRGFMWFSNSEGTARFDGYTFTRFGPEAGFPGQGDFRCPANAGRLLLVRRRTVPRWIPPKPGEGTCLPATGPISATCLLEDRLGTLWCGTASGLYKVDRNKKPVSLAIVDLGLPRRLWDDPIVSALAEKPEGGLWVGVGSGLYSLEPDGRVRQFTEVDGLPDRMIRSLAVDRMGHFGLPPAGAWAGSATGRSGTLQIDQVSTGEGMGSPDVLALLHRRGIDPGRHGRGSEHPEPRADPEFRRCPGGQGPRFLPC